MEAQAGAWVGDVGWVSLGAVDGAVRDRGGDAGPEPGGWVIGVVEGELPGAGVPAEHLVRGGLADPVTAVVANHEELADGTDAVIEAAGHGEAGQRAVGGDEACLPGVFGEVVVEVPGGSGEVGAPGRGVPDQHTWLRLFQVPAFGLFAPVVVAAEQVALPSSVTPASVIPPWQLDRRDRRIIRLCYDATV